MSSSDIAPNGFFLEENWVQPKTLQGKNNLNSPYLEHRFQQSHQIIRGIQIWLSPLEDDHQLTYFTNVKKKNPLHYELIV
jgi:hypothetical protein